MAPHNKKSDRRLAAARAPALTLALAVSIAVSIAVSMALIVTADTPVDAQTLATGAVAATAASTAVTAPAAPAFSCRAPAEFARFNNPLRHTAQRLAMRLPLTVVAVGSSSTAGAGASSAAASYPSRLAVELKQRFPGADITVINRGVNGDETVQMMARFETGVIAAHPDLVVWQVGTNSVLRDYPLKPHSALLREGIEQLKGAGADVVLMDMQFAPRVVAKPETPGMEEQIAIAAKAANVDLFGRFAIMRDWSENQHLPFPAFISADGLHMNDWGYGCLAKLLATAIAEAATRPVASAAAHSR